MTWLINVWLACMIDITCHLFMIFWFLHLISMFHLHFFLTWWLLPFRGMLSFHHVHLLPPSLDVVWNDTLMMIIGLSCVIVMYKSIYPSCLISLCPSFLFKNCWLILLTWMDVCSLDCLCLEFNSCLEFLYAIKYMVELIILYIFFSSLLTMSPLFRLFLLKHRVDN